MGGLYTEPFLQHLRDGAASLVLEWGLSEKTSVGLMTVSENATFRADDPERAAPVVLRVHRPGYHTRAEIESELAWIEALRAESILSTPAPLPCRSGGHVARFFLEGAPRDVVAFEYMSGAEPSPREDLTEGFAELGQISARLHAHARRWQRPAKFERKVWNFTTTIGETPHWGVWSDAVGLEADGRDILATTAAALENRLGEIGTSPEVFGLIHADLRLANLLVDDGRIGVIDFDDCGFGWFLFDFAAAISFIETDPAIPQLKAAWLEGYRTISSLPRSAETDLDIFIMLRRLQLTAWIASHPETPTAQEMGAGFSDGTVALAGHFLAAQA
jgi:Ser/Thr protein kinase RdoA (MazF antagonist)